MVVLSGVVAAQTSSGSAGGPELPGSISDLSVSSVTQTTALLSFTPAADAASYEYRLDAGPAATLASDKIVTGLAAETEYDFEVRGVNGDGNGPWSNVATATTEAEEVEEPGDLTALTAPTLTRTSGAEDYPPAIDFDRPVDWIDGDQAVMQRSQDATFATGVSEAVQTMYAATTSYDFGLSSVVSGSWFFRMAAWRGTRPADEDQNWSNIVNVGDVVAPTITTNGTQAAMSIPLTANEGVTWEIVGGAQASEWTIDGSDNLVPVSGGASTSVNEIIVRATDYAGLSTDKTITNTLDITPAAFTFTDVSSATTATQYTSDTIAVSGLGSGVAAAISVNGGTYSKNGGAYTSAPGFVVNGDTITARGISGGSATNTDVVVTIGSVSDTYRIATLGMAWTQVDGFDKHTDIDVSGTPTVTATNTNSGSSFAIRASSAIVPTKFHLEVTIGTMPTGEEVVFGFDNGGNDFTSNMSLAFPWDLPGIFVLAMYPVGAGFSGSAWRNVLLSTSIADKTVNTFATDTDATHARATGDIFIFEGDRSTGNVKVWRKAGGTGSPALVVEHTAAYLVGSSWRPYFQARSPASVTINGGHAAFSMTPTSGYSAADGS